MVLRAIKDVVLGPTKFNLEDLEGFPYEDYETQWTEYTEAERWFTGAALDDQPDTANRADLYPMRINPIVGTVLKHAYILFGEVEDDGRPLVVPKLIYKNKDKPPKTSPKNPPTDSPDSMVEDEPQDEEEPETEPNPEKDAATHAEDRLNFLWWENHGRALMIQNAIISQIYGGCVFKASFTGAFKEEGWREVPLRIEVVPPKCFIGYPDPADDFRLSEAWIVKQINYNQAKAYGATGDPEEEFWYVEHWLPDKIDITINGKPASYKGNPLGGKNPWGFIPMVYIPHVRVAQFRGFNAYSHLVGLVKELNRSWGDYGDAINDDSHPIIAVRNVNGTIKVMRVNEYIEVADIGSQSGIGVSEGEPDMFQVNQPRASKAMEDAVAGILAQYRRDSFTPAVADGEDEGSQRSSLTLATRFWPLMSHANTERYFWTCGLDVFQSMILRMLKIKKLEGINEKHTKLRMKQKWAPLLPRDREVEVNEWGIRSSNSIASIEHLIEMAGDVEDVPEERERILRWVSDLEEAKLKAQHRMEMELADKQAEVSMEQAEMQADTQKEIAKEQGCVQLAATELQGKNQLAVAKAKPKPTAAGKKPNATRPAAKSK